MDTNTVNHNRVTNNTYYDGMDWTFDQTTQEHHTHHHIANKNHGGTFHGGTTSITNVIPDAGRGIGVGVVALGIGATALGLFLSVAFLVVGGAFMALCAVAYVTLPRVISNADNQRHRRYALQREDRRFEHEYELNEQKHRHRLTEIQVAIEIARNEETLRQLGIIEPKRLSAPAQGPVIVIEEAREYVHTNR